MLSYLVSTNRLLSQKDEIFKELITHRWEMGFILVRAALYDFVDVPDYFEEFAVDSANAVHGQRTFHREKVKVTILYEVEDCIPIFSFKSKISVWTVDP